MRRILFAAAATFAFGTLAVAQPVDVSPAPDASQGPSSLGTADQASPAMSHTGHATHDTTGIGTHGNHPVHGKLHGHRNRHACKKHCQEHHDARAGVDDAARAAAIEECKKICDEHHKKDSPTNPAGNKVAKP